MKYRDFDGDTWLDRRLALADGDYQVVPEDMFEAADRMAFVRLGRKARVYKVLRHDGSLHALKVFYRGLTQSEYVPITKGLTRFEGEPGLTVCRRRVIDQWEATRNGEPGLSGSILMPWIIGVPWVDLIEARRPLSKPACLSLAKATVTVLARLESRRLAHGDISSSNVLITGSDKSPTIELIDVEDMYHPEFGDLTQVTDGSVGYTHPANKGLGCRNPCGDRFAAGILLAEILIWHDAALLATAADASLFEQDELCVAHPKQQRVLRLLKARSPEVAELFQRTWRSAGLATCPRLSEWAAAIGVTLPPAHPDDEIVAEQSPPKPRQTPEPSRKISQPPSVDRPEVPQHEDIKFIPLDFGQ